MSQESASASANTPESSMFSEIKAFFSVPNPNIFKVFVSSGAATVVLGAAMIAEWILYSRHHQGFHWIIYYAPCLVALPLITWALSAFSAAIVCLNKNRNLAISPLSDSKESEQSDKSQQIQPEPDRTPQDHQLAMVKVAQVVDDDDDDILLSSDFIELQIQPEQDQMVQDHQLVQDQLAMVKVDLVLDDHDNPSNLVEELPGSIKNIIGDNSMLKRISSWPLLSGASSCGKSKRSISF